MNAIIEMYVIDGGVFGFALIHAMRIAHDRIIILYHKFYANLSWYGKKIYCRLNAGFVEMCLCPHSSHLTQLQYFSNNRKLKTKRARRSLFVRRRNYRIFLCFECTSLRNVNYIVRFYEIHCIDENSIDETATMSIEHSNSLHHAHTYLTKAVVEGWYARLFVVLQLPKTKGEKCILRNCHYGLAWEPFERNVYEILSFVHMNEHWAAIRNVIFLFYLQYCPMSVSV